MSSEQGHDSVGKSAVHPPSVKILWDPQGWLIF